MTDRTDWPDARLDRLEARINGVPERVEGLTTAVKYLAEAVTGLEEALEKQISVKSAGSFTTRAAFIGAAAVIFTSFMSSAVLLVTQL